jgi:hypothetical protein
MNAYQLNQRQKEIADREGGARSAQSAAAHASTQRQAEYDSAEQPIRHWWLHPRDFADNPN